ncbi:MAG: alpha-ketoacid dehydrogenase subunit beta [Eubacteriaceae bacterium]|nr:alpha-ketoacid dehydrogenase subunit beta [Eubacteriaceae bacterium]
MKSYLEAINEGIRLEMRRDERVCVLGEDVGVYGGGAGATRGLIEEFTERRVMDMPISETAFTGAAVGAAMLGMRPIVEIMFSDFLTLAADPLINHAAKMPFMSAGQTSVPLVVMTPMGSGTGAAAQHSQSPEMMFMNTPGIKIVTPSNPYNAKGLMISAIRDEGPVIYLEHKGLYNMKGEVPEGEYTLPIGKASVIRPGEDITIITYSAMAKECLAAARELSEIRISAEVIDLMSLKPLDEETLIESVKKTGRVLIVHEAPALGGFGGYIAGVIAQRAFKYLKAPIKCLGGENIPIAYNAVIERMQIPGKEKIIKTAEEILNEEV